MAAKFTVGNKVNHPQAADVSFPSGIGSVTSVSPSPSPAEYLYEVRCDKTGNVLPVKFKESELTIVV